MSFSEVLVENTNVNFKENHDVWMKTMILVLKPSILTKNGAILCLNSSLYEHDFLIWVRHCFLYTIVSGTLRCCWG